MSEMKAPREVLGDTLIILGKKNPNIVVLDADFNPASKIRPFMEQFPDRFIQAGIAEQNMMSVAAGMAAMGFIPFVSTIAVFCSRRACDQVTVSVALPNLNVKILAVYPGLFVGLNGASHQSLEDISIMRAIPNMSVVQPADAVEMESILQYVAHHAGPMYIRVGRDAVPQYVPNDYQFKLGASLTLKDGNDMTLMTYGELVGDTLEAASMLDKKGIQARVINMSSIKPIDENTILKAAQETGRILTVDNHNIYGGMGSVVCEVVCEKYPVPVKRMGVKDVFGKSGSNDAMKKKFGLRAEDIYQEAVNLLKNEDKI